MPDRCSRPLRTLIADASAAFRGEVVRWIGDREDLTVIGTAASGSEVLPAVELLDPDLVLLDGALPGMDGFHVVRLLKARPRAPLAVIVTFFATSAARGEALAAGADGFIPKDEFNTAFERLLARWLETGEGQTTDSRVR